MNYEHLIQKMEEIISLLPSKKNEGGGCPEPLVST